MSGAGPFLLLVHGGNTDHRCWHPLVSAFEAHFTVVNMDRRGRGMSGDGLNYSLAREANDVAEIVSELGGDVSVCGYSYGAVCALEAALDGAPIGRLVLYEPPFPTHPDFPPPGFTRRMYELVGNGDTDAASSAFLRDIIGISERTVSAMKQTPLWGAGAHELPRLFEALDAYEFDPSRFERCKVPSLVLLGQDTADFLQDAAATISTLLPRATKKYVGGLRHFAISTHTEEFAAAVLEFLTSPTAS